MHLVTVLCTRKGHITTSLTRPEPEEAPEGDTSSLWASKYLPHLWKTVFHPQNITADLHDYWNCHELLDLRTYFYNLTPRRSHLHMAQPSQSVKADWTSPRFDLENQELKFCKTDVWDITLLYTATAFKQLLLQPLQRMVGSCFLGSNLTI